MRLFILLLLLALSASIFARDLGEKRMFRALNPCPATQRTNGPCPGWVVDHFIPLCAGGADRPSNMQWQPLAQSRLKDKIEIRYCRCLAREIGPCN